MDLGKKLGVYWLINMVAVILNIGKLSGSINPGGLLLLISLAASTIVFIWFMIVVYRDATKRGLSKAWVVAVFLFGPIGGTIYYLKARNKPKM